MNVYLTVDVESYTGDFEREVFADGRGLEFIVEACRRHDAKATFFVEALGATQWGKEPLRQICDMLKAAGQDTQLHLHPSVARIDQFEDHDDVLSLRDRATQEMLLRVGLESLRECAGNPVTAFRAGDLAANLDTLAAMQAVGLSISANRDLDQKCSIRTQLNDHFPAKNELSQRDGITDVPVSALKSPLPFLDGRYRHFEISAMGINEMCSGLKAMSRQGYQCAGILTHPGEFFRYHGDRCESIAKNRFRLESLLRFVASRDDMQWSTVGAINEVSDVPAASPPEIRGNLIFALVRVAEQAFDRLWARI